MCVCIYIYMSVCVGDIKERRKNIGDRAVLCFFTAVTIP